MRVKRKLTERTTRLNIKSKRLGFSHKFQSRLLLFINEVIKGHLNEFLIKIEQEDKDISSIVPDISLSEIIADLKLLFKINE